MAFRILEYSIRIMRDHVGNKKEFKLPIIIPMLFYHGQHKYTGTTNIFDLFGENKELAESVFLKPFKLFDVNEIEDHELKRSVLAGTMKFILKHAAKRNTIHYLEQIADNFKTIEKSDIELLTPIIRYIMLMSEVNDKKDIITFIKKNLSEETANKMATTAELFRQEGKQEEKRHIVLNMLKKHVPVNQISDYTELSVEEINKIRKQASNRFVELK